MAPEPRSSPRTRGSGTPAGSPAGPSAALAATRRTLTPENIFEVVASVAASGPALFGAFLRPSIPPALREKVMLGVTSVTNCRYCTWGHTHWAMARGVPLEEINQILGHQAEAMKAANPAEAAAILFGQYYAGHYDVFDPGSTDSLREHFSEAQVAEILAWVRVVTLGSLIGNSVDLFLGRVRSDGETDVAFLGAVSLLAAPVLLLAALLIGRWPHPGGIKGGHAMAAGDRRIW